MNVDPDDARTVTVQMFNWSTGLPVLLALLDTSTQTVPPNRWATFRSVTLPAGLFAYKDSVSLSTVVHIFYLQDEEHNHVNKNDSYN